MGFDELLTSNVNATWIKGIHDEIKATETMIRWAREGCNSLLEYVLMDPRQKNIQLAYLQYKNLRFLLTEMILLAGNLTPIIEEGKSREYLDEFKKIEKIINNEDIFIKKETDVRGNLKSASVTPFFAETLEHFEEKRREILWDIRHILFITDDSTEKRW